MADHALGEEPGEGLVELQVAALAHRPGEEARVEQVQHGVLDAADVLVDRQPVVDRRPIHRLLRLRAAEAGVVPGGVDKGIHGVSVALGRAAAGRAVDVLPGRMVGQRIARLVEGRILGQRYRQIVFRHRNDPAVGTMDHRDRAAPVALPRHTPVAQAILDLALALVVRLEPADRRVDRLGDREAVQEVGVNDPALASEGRVADRVARLVLAVRQHHRRHRQAVLVGEVQVALVVRWAAEDRAGAVVHQHEIGDEDRQLLARNEGMQCLQPRVEAPLFGRLNGLLAGAQAVALGDEGGQLGAVLGERGREGVVRRESAEGGAEKRVGPRGEDLERLIAILDPEVDARAARAADPLVLHDPDLLRPSVQGLERLQQVVGVGGDLEEPLGQLAPLDQRIGAPAAAVDHLLVGQDGLVDRIPVDPGFLAVDQALLEEVQEHLLLVLVIVRQAGRDLPAPVDREAHALQLGAHHRDVL